MSIKTKRKLKSSNFYILGFLLTLLFLQTIQVSTLIATENNGLNIDSEPPTAAVENAQPVYETYWGRSDGAGSGQKEFESPSQVCSDLSGNIYVLDVDNERIQKFNPTGDYLTEFPAAEAYYLDIDTSAGLLYVANSSGIQILQTDGTVSDNWMLPSGTGDGEFGSIGGLGLNDTHIFIGDYGYGNIQVFDKATHTFVAKFDKDGEQMGQVSDIAINQTGYIYVGTGANGEVQLYDPNYNLVDNITVAGVRVDALLIDNEGNVFADLNVYDQNLNLKYAYASFGMAEGTIWGPNGFTMANGYLYVTERYNHRVSLFKYGPKPPEAGIAWEEFKLLTPEGTYNPSWSDLAMDSKGNLHYVWQDGDNGFGTASANDIYYRWLNIKTGEWSGIMMVSDGNTLNAGNGYNPTVAIDQTGKVHIAWTAIFVNELTHDVLYRTFEPSNQTWSNIVLITPEFNNKAGQSVMEVDSIGNPHFFWMDTSDYSSKSNSYIDLYYRNMTASTGVLNEVVLIEEGVENNHPRDIEMDVDSNDNVHFIWRSGVTGNHNYRNISSTGELGLAKTWAFSPWEANLQVDSDGNVHVVWTNNQDTAPGDSNGKSDVYYFYYLVSSNSWSNPVCVSNGTSAGDDDNPYITLDKDGKVHFVWSNQTRIFYRNYNLTSDEWSTIDSPQDHQSPRAYWPKIGVDLNNELHIIWADGASDLLGSGSDYDIFYRTNAYLPTNLAYRSVITNLNATVEIWKFFGAEKAITADAITYIESNVTSYNMRAKTWSVHRKLGEGYKNITMYKDTTKEDVAIPKMAWGSRDELNLPNLKWRYDSTGEEIADIYGATIDTAIYDTETTGDNWVKFTSSNTLYKNYFIYLRVNEAGILEEFQHQERREKIHLILEDDYVKFLNDQGIAYSADQEPIYMRSSTEPKNNVPSSASRTYISTSMGNLPIFPWGAQESTPLYRYTPTTTVTTVDTYDGPGLKKVEEETFAISKPEVEMVTTHQIAEVEYYDETSGSWKPSDNGNGDNTYIIGSANRETSLPLIMGDDFKMPMVLPEDPLFPSNKCIADVLGDAAVVQITGNSIYIEMTIDGTDYYVDVEYGEDGTATTYEARLPSEGGVQEVEMNSLTETEALAYIEEIDSGTTNGTTTDDDHSGDDDTLHIPGYAPITFIWVGLISVTMLFHKSKKKKKIFESID